MTMRNGQIVVIRTPKGEEVMVFIGRTRSGGLVEVGVFAPREVVIARASEWPRPDTGRSRLP